jgi:hypothetical protein
VAALFEGIRKIGSRRADSRRDAEVKDREQTSGHGKTQDTVVEGKIHPHRQINGNEREEGGNAG